MNVIMLLLLGLMQSPPIEVPTFTIDDVSVSDVDVGDGDMKLSLSVDKGTLSVASVEGLVFETGDGTKDENIVCTGRIDDINRALSSLRYYVKLNATGTDSLEIVIDDQGHTGTGGAKTDTESIVLTIPSINQTPVITVPGPQATQEDIAKVIYGVKVADGDIGNGDIKITITTLHGTLDLRQGTYLEFTTGASEGSKKMVFTGPLPSVNSALSFLRYTPDKDFSGTDTITITANDQGNTGEGGPKEGSETIEISITPVNDSPVIKRGSDDPISITPAAGGIGG